MKLLIIHQHFFPEPGGTAKPAYELARYFSNKGHEVSVITEFPNRNFESVSVNKNTPLKKEVINNIQIYRIKNIFKYSHNVIQRMLAYLWFTLASFVHGIKLSYGYKNQIIFTIQAIPSALPGALLSILFKQKHVFYCTDMMPDLGIVSGLLKNKILIRALHAFENFTYKHCVAIFAVTPMMVDEIKQRTSNPNVFELSDWLDDEHYQKNKNKYISKIVKKYNLMDKRVLLYIGNIGFLQNIGIFVDLAKKIHEDNRFSNYYILIGGNGVQAEILKERVEKYKLNNIKFIGIVDREQVPSFLNLSDILLMNYLDHPHMQLYRSSKVFDYIIAQKPVLVGARGELEKIVVQNNIGLASNPSDVDDLYNNLLKIRDRNYSINNKTLIEEFRIDNVLNKFEDKLISLEKM